MGYGMSVWIAWVGLLVFGGFWWTDGLAGLLASLVVIKDWLVGLGFELYVMNCRKRELQACASTKWWASFVGLLCLSVSLSGVAVWDFRLYDGEAELAR